MAYNARVLLNMNEQFSQRQQSNIDHILTVDVVIPSKTNISNYDMLENCISSLRQSEKNIKFNICIVESGPNFIDKGQDITIKYDRDIFCYNHALNQGIAKGSSEWIILANNDLIFKNNFMVEILLANHMNPEIMSFSPWNSMWYWHERIYGTFHPTEKIIEGYRIGHELTGWCIIVKRAIFNKIELSEGVKFWYSDNVYADALLEAGLRHALVTGSKVDHIVSQTKVMTGLEMNQAYHEYSLFREVSCGHRQSDLPINSDN